MTSGLIILLAAASVSPSQSAESTAHCIKAKLEPSLGVIDQMIANNLDLAKPRLVTQLFLGPSGSVRSLIKDLPQTRYLPAPDGNENHHVFAQRTVLSKAWVRSVIPQMCASATRAAAEYDGWDVDVASDHIASEAKK